jgi:hypothetical protein
MNLFSMLQEKPRPNSPYELQSSFTQKPMGTHAHNAMSHLYQKTLPTSSSKPVPRAATICGAPKQKNGMFKIGKSKKNAEHGLQ